MDKPQEQTNPPQPQTNAPEMVTQSVEQNINEAAIEIGEALKRRGLGMQAAIQIFKPESPIVAMGNGEIPEELLKSIGQEKGDAITPVTDTPNEAEKGTAA